MAVHTSKSDPIRVDFVDAEKFGVRGKLGLTFAPGKVFPYSLSGDWRRDLDTDLIRIRDHYRCDVLVSLIEEFEFEMLQIPELRPRAIELGIQSLWFPIRDMSVPRDPEKFRHFVFDFSDMLRAGSTIVVHCMGGLGRAGLTAACSLTVNEAAPDIAIKEVRKARPGAIQTLEQEQFVKDFARSLSG